MAETKLLPCPFCGSEPTEFLEHEERTFDLVPGASVPLAVSTARNYYGVRCDACDVGITNPRISHVSAIKHWNTRTPSVNQRLLRALKSLAEDSSCTCMFPTDNCCLIAIARTVIEEAEAHESR